MLFNAVGNSFTTAQNNEDSFGVLDHCAWVLDGSTGLNGNRLVSKAPDSDAAWYSKRFSAFLAENLPDRSKSLKEIFAEGIKTVWQEFSALANGPVLPDDVPCTLGTAVRATENTLEYICVGDCPLLARFKDGTVKEFRDQTLVELDRESLSIMTSLASEHSLHNFDCRKLLLPRLKEVRRLAGVENGYVALTNHPECIQNALYGMIPLDSVSDFCMLTDGFEQYYALFGLCSKEEFLSLAANEDHQKLFEVLTQAQKADPTGDLFPRFKPSDDATLLYCKLS